MNEANTKRLFMVYSAIIAPIIFVMFVYLDKMVVYILSSLLQQDVSPGFGIIGILTIKLVYRIYQLALTKMGYESQEIEPKRMPKAPWVKP